MFSLITKRKAGELALKAAEFATRLTISQFPSTSRVVYGYNDAGGHLDAYASIDDLYSIVRKIAKTCKRVPLYEYDVKEEKAYSKYRLMQRKAGLNPSMKAIWDLKELQYKSMELVGESGQIQKILDNPNSVQSKDEFYEAAYSFPLLCGNEYIWMNVLQEGGNQGKLYAKDALFHLPPNYTFPEISDTWPRRITAYQLRMNGLVILDTSDVLHRKYFNPIYDFAGNELIGLSPLTAAAKTLTQISNERDYSNRSLMNAGAEGAIVGDPPEGMSDEAVGSMKEDVLRELGPVFDSAGSNLNAKKLAMIMGKWTYLKTAISPVDMAVVEQSKQTFKKMCNIYGVSDIWFNNDTAATESNVKEMIQQAYTNCIIPEVCGLRDLLQKGIAFRYQTDRIKKVIDYDISDIPELQENANEVVKRFAEAPAFRITDLYEATGWGKLDPAEFPGVDKILVKQGYTPLEDYSTDLTDPETLGKYNDYNRNAG